MLTWLILQAVAQAAAPSVSSAPPVDWATLAPMPYLAAPQVTPAMNQFVAGEIASGRCARIKPVDGHYVVRVDVATLLGPDGSVRKTVPRAIACPTVEQFSAGLVQSFTRSNLQNRATATADQWYRATIVFDWVG